MPNRESVAVVGCGVAGLTAAYLLQRRYEVTLYEKNHYLGGHTHTLFVPDGPDAGTPVDTGFIVCNNRTYPLFHRLLWLLDVPVRTSEMSFSYHDEQSGLLYAGTGLNGLFAQRRNLVRPAFWRLLHDIRRFAWEGSDALSGGRVPTVTIGEYVQQGHYSAEFMEWYLAPMMAAIWSSPPTDTAAFPAAALLRFFRNHGLLSLRDRPTWQTVVGGSHTYVQAFSRNFHGVVRSACPVRSIRRTGPSVVITTDTDHESYDKVVIATHGDEALALLADPTDEERRLLGPWRYEQNRVLLHTDSSVLPAPHRARASWNYLRERGDDTGRPVSVSYYMNRLQGLRTRRDYCVSLNLHRRVAPGSTVCDLTYAHPLYSFASLAAQKELPTLNGKRQTYFCGSYFGYGFHEDAVRSAVTIGHSLGIDL